MNIDVVPFTERGPDVNRPFLSCILNLDCSNGNRSYVLHRYKHNISKGTRWTGPGGVKFYL